MIQLYELCGADEKLLFSPHCWKVRLSLAHKGLDYETLPVGFSELGAIEGGSGKVPVLRDGETVVNDSLEIALYLDRTYPDAPVLVRDLPLTRFVINWSQTQLHPAVARHALMDIYKLLSPADQDYFRTTREKLFGMTLEEFDAKFPKEGKELAAALVPLAVTLKGQTFLGGESPDFADYVVFGALQWLRVTASVDVVPQEGPVAEWFARLLDMYDGDGRSVPKAA